MQKFFGLRVGRTTPVALNRRVVDAQCAGSLAGCGVSRHPAPSNRGSLSSQTTLPTNGGLSDLGPAAVRFDPAAPRGTKTKSPPRSRRLDMA
ncbi:hypothetical protein LSAT2_017537, partial [Lamellibrachia satsuma]